MTTSLASTKCPRRAAAGQVVSWLPDSRLLLAALLHTAKTLQKPESTENEDTLHTLTLTRTMQFVPIETLHNKHS